MKNVIFIVNIKGDHHHDDFSKYCLLSWDYWTRKNGVTLFVLDKPFQKAESCAPHLQKYFAFEALKKYGIDADQVAIVDADTMVRWDCPYFFDIPQGNFCAVLDDELPKWVVRSLDVYQFLFPDTKVNWWEYFNSGFMIFGKEHSKLLSGFADFFLSNKSGITKVHDEHNLRVGFDQTLFNFFVKERRIPVTFLPKTFNFYHLSRKGVLEQKEFVDFAYVWHFNGIKHSERERYMAETWELVKKNYQIPAGL